MKAVVFHEPGGPDKLSVGEFPPPKPGPGEALVRVKACALNHIDVWVISGSPAYKVPLPHAPGSDIAGVVESPVEGFPSGTRVVVMPLSSCGKCQQCVAGRSNLCGERKVIGASPRWGGYAELVAVPSAQLIALPDSVSFVQAAALPVAYMTAWHMLTCRAGVKSGESVLVTAAGSGVGSAAIVLARHLGAKVYATAGNEAKRTKAKGLGAEATFDHGDPDFAKQVVAATGGRGVDVVVDCVGTPVLERTLASLSAGGRLATCGATVGIKVEFELRSVFGKQLSVLGSYLGTKDELETLASLVAAGKFKPIIDSEIPASSVRQGLEKMLSRGSFGKIVLVR
jgi:NADPH:quinone reductase-like Zn-dependent oxidoreductase